PPAELLHEQLVAPLDLVPVLQPDDEEIRKTLDLTRTITVFAHDACARGGRHSGNGRICAVRLPAEPPRCSSRWSGRPDLNRGPLVPQTSALTRLRHAPSGAR